MPRIWSKGAVSSGSGGETYKAGEGLEESGSKPVTFKAKLGAGLSFVTGKVSIAAKAITDAMLAETYALLAGRPAGQELFGSSVEEGGDLVLKNWLGTFPSWIEITSAGEIRFSTTQKVVVGGSGQLEVPIIEGLVVLEAQKVIPTVVFQNKGSTSYETGGELTTPKELTASQNDYVPKFTEGEPLKLLSWYRLTASKALNITGWAPGSEEQVRVGREIKVTNVGTFAITFVSESASSEAANRFAFESVLAAGQSIDLIYDSVLERWRLLNVSYSVNLSGAQTIAGVKTFKEETKYEGALVGTSTGSFTSTLTAKSTLTVEGAATIAKTLKVTETLTAKATLTVEGAATVAKTLSVTEGIKATKAIGLWAKTPPTSQHARIAKVEPIGIGALLTEVIGRLNETSSRLDEVTQEVLPEYGNTA